MFWFWIIIFINFDKTFYSSCGKGLLQIVFGSCHKFLEIAWAWDCCSRQELCKPWSLQMGGIGRCSLAICPPVNIYSEPYLCFEEADREVNNKVELEIIDAADCY